MRSDLRRLLLVTLLAVGCGEILSSPFVGAPVEGVSARALGPATVEVTWTSQPSASRGYRIERRDDFQGSFRIVSGIVAADQEPRYVDATVSPNRFYTYRVIGVTNLDETLPPSLKVVAETPPLPGLLVRTQVPAGTGQTVGLSSVQIVVRNARDSVVFSSPLAINTGRTLTPLPLGQYSVVVRGLPSLCAVDGDSLRTARVRDDLGIRTIDSVSYGFVCRDPRFARLNVRVNASGNTATIRPRLRVVGQVNDPTLPPAERLVSRSEPLTLAPNGTASVTFDLRPTTYDLTLDSLAAGCVMQGAVPLQVNAVGGTTPLVVIDVGCTTVRPPLPPDSVKPYRFRAVFSPASARVGDTVLLNMTYDPTVRMQDSVAGVVSDIAFETSVLQPLAGSAGTRRVSDPFSTTINQNLSPGEARFSATSLDGIRVAGPIDMGGIRFRVVGGAGRSTSVLPLRMRAIRSPGVDVPDSLVIGVPGDLAIASSGGTPPPDAVIARANGPYAAAVGQTVTFSSAGSTAGATVSWSFSDGQSLSGTSVSRSFTSAGSFIARVTVQVGATTARDSAVVTVTAGAPPPPAGALRAEANGPYTATVGSPVQFSSSGSTGAIQSYLWLFSDNANQRSTQPNPSFTYTTAGTYVVRLEVSDENGAVSTDSAVVTITAVGTPPPAPVVVARANGPYSGTVGQAIAFSSAGSTSGADVTYQWTWSDGAATSPQASPTRSFGSTGTFMARLAVTRNGTTARDSATVTITNSAPPPSGGAPTVLWSFESLGNGDVRMTATVDLSSDLAQTPGPEVLDRWSIDQVRFDPGVLQFKAVSLGQFWCGVTVQDRANQGILSLSNISSCGASNRTGVITLARIVFAPVGPRGSSTTTVTALGPFIGSVAETGGFNYSPLLRLVEGTFTTP